VTVIKAFNKCVRCFPTKTCLVEHIMADLPKERLDGSHVFKVTGIDYCGQFLFKSVVRNKLPVKDYACVFFCFATKAIQLELTKDLSTISFLHGLKRFLCFIRGRGEFGLTMQPTLFKLRRLFLSDDHEKSTFLFCLSVCINLFFIPSRSSHFDGLWKRL